MTHNFDSLFHLLNTLALGLDYEDQDCVEDYSEKPSQNASFDVDRLLQTGSKKCWKSPVREARLAKKQLIITDWLYARAANRIGIEKPF